MPRPRLTTCEKNDKLKVNTVATKMEPNSLRTLAKLYLAWSQCNKRSHRNDEIALRHIVEFFGNCKLSEITRLRAEQYRQRRRAEILAKPKYQAADPRSVSLAAINREIACLRHMLTMAAEWQLLPNNPLFGLRAFREIPRDRVLTPNEYARLIAYAAPLTQRLIKWAINTGMRVSEITGLTWGDIDLSKRVAILRHTKNGKVRYVPLNTGALQVLYIQSRQAKGDYVFHFHGQRMKRVDNGFEHACRRAGITNLRFHDLRHCFATALTESGCDLVTLKDLMGHSSLSMVARYSHPCGEHKLRAVEKLPANFFAKNC